MPELPEVETIKRGLEKQIIGLTIKSVEILNPKTFQGDPNAIKNYRIVGVRRMAKVLIIDLEPSLRATCSDLKSEIASSFTTSRNDRLSLLFHLKMSGQVIYLKNNDNSKPLFAGGHPTKDMTGEMPNKSTRVIFHLDDDSNIYFNDQRKFGWIKVVNSHQLLEISFLKNLGPEPLEQGFTPEILETNLSRRQKTAVKVAILDQQIISGIGNIYACESCFIAGIHPTRLVSKLSKKDYLNLHKGIIQSLEQSLEYGGSTKQHFYNANGEQGYFLEVAYVYDRKGKPCRICQTPIEKITLGGRGTYYCPKCQG